MSTLKITSFIINYLGWVYNVFMIEKNKNVLNNLENKSEKTPFLRKILSKIVYIILVPIISICILLAVFFKITEEKYAKNTLTMIIATSFSQKGIDDETEIIDLKKEIDSLNTDFIYPIEGLLIKVERKDIENLSPKDLRLKLFSQIANILYDQDKNELDKIITDENMRKDIKNAGFLSLISRDGHKKIENIFLYSIFAVAILSTFVYLINKGINRIIVPAKAVVFASLPGLIISFGVKLFISSDKSIVSSDSNFSQLFTNIIKNALPETIDIFFKTYLWVFVTGASVFTATNVYLFWKKIFKKKVVS